MSFRFRTSVPSDTKKDATDTAVTSAQDLDLELEHGHLMDLEVDVQHVVGDVGIDDIEGGSSPYPEGWSQSFFCCYTVKYCEVG